MKRVAMFMTASLRSTPAGTFTPALVHLVEQIALEYDLTVFTVTPPTGETEPYRCGKAQICVVPVRHNEPVLHRTYSLCRAFFSTHRQQPFDILHGFWATPGGMAAVASGRLARLPSIVTIQGGEAASLPLIGYGNMTHLSTRQATLWVCRHATALVALTRFQADAIGSFGLKRDVRIIPYGASPSFFCNAPGRQVQTPVRFLHVADINKVKDQETLLKGFRILARQLDCELTFAGRDLLGGRLQRLAGELGIQDKVRFLGHVHHDLLPPLYLSADFLLHTSLYEAQGVVISEAYAAGCVVCGTRVGLVADLEGTCAVAVPPGDAEALAEAVISLLQNPSLYRQIQAAAGTWAMEHNAAWTAAQYSRLYEELLNF